MPLSPRSVFLSLLVTLALSLVMSVWLMPQLLAMSGGLQIMDTRLWYTADDVASLLGALGPDGRAMYSYLQLVDTIYPAAYAITFALVLAFMLERTGELGHRLRLLFIVPYLAALADYIENILMATQIATYPSISADIVTAASIATTIKWALIGLSSLLVVIIGLYVVYLRWQQRAAGA